MKNISETNQTPDLTQPKDYDESQDIYGGIEEEHCCPHFAEMGWRCRMTFLLIVFLSATGMFALMNWLITLIVY